MRSTVSSLLTARLATLFPNHDCVRNSSNSNASIPYVDSCFSYIQIYMIIFSYHKQKRMRSRSYARFLVNYFLNI